MENQIAKVDPDRFYDGEKLNQMLVVANQFFKAGCFGGDVKNPQQAYAKIQAGREMGLAPMESMNSLYIVNGHITMWGMALTKRLREFGWTIDYKDDAESCTVTIENDKESHTYTATAAELRKMNSKAFLFAPKEKLRWHAISRLVRFNVPEVMGGSVMYLKEEADDMPNETSTVVEIPVIRDILTRISNCDSLDELEAYKMELPKIINHYSQEEKTEIGNVYKAKVASFRGTVPSEVVLKKEEIGGDGVGFKPKEEIEDKEVEEVLLKESEHSEYVRKTYLIPIQNVEEEANLTSIVLQAGKDMKITVKDANEITKMCFDMQKKFKAPVPVSKRKSNEKGIE